MVSLLCLADGAALIAVVLAADSFSRESVMTHIFMLMRVRVVNRPSIYCTIFGLEIRFSVVCEIRSVCECVSGVQVYVLLGKGNDWV